MSGGHAALAARVRVRPWHVAVGCLAAGLALASAAAPLQLGAAAAVAAVLVACRAPRLAALGAALVLTGAAAGEARLSAIDRSATLIGDGQQARLRVHLVTRPRPSAFGASAEVRVSGGGLDGARLLLRIPRWSKGPAPAAIGQELLVEGRLRRPRSDPADDFDFAAHLRRRGIAGELLLDRAAVTGRRRAGIAGLLDRMRARAERGVAAGLARPDAALARGMVLGQDEQIDSATRQDWRDAGLAHLLAVSGQNVMLLVALALPLVAVAGLGPRGRGAALLGLLALYVPLAGAGPSLQRAGVMGAAGIAAMTLSRPSSRWYALLLAAAVTLALNPRACADPGWQLSFAAVVGILTLGRPLAGALARAGDELAREPARPAGRAIRRAVADGIAITIAATLATAPLLAFHFGSIPLAALPANLLALPAVAPAMWLGMVKASLGLAAPLLPPADSLAEALGPLSRVPISYLGLLAERWADVPGGQVAIPVRTPLSVLSVYAGIGLVALTVRRLGARARRAEPAELAAAWRRRPLRLRAAAATAVAAATLLAASALLEQPAPPDVLTVRFLDIGQGDATLIQAPGGVAVLFDGGPPEGGVTTQLRRAGVRRLSMVVMTHQSRDHHGGLQAVVERYPVDTLVENGDGTRDPTFWRVVRTAREGGARVIGGGGRQRLAAGGLTVNVLGPPPRAPGPAPEDPNPRALACIVSYGGFDLFLSGDAESDSLTSYELPQVEAMKVSHHGSDDPGLPQLLERLRPRVAAIEVGADNTYGHPTASTLAALRAAVPHVYRTDRDGTVTLTARRSAFDARTER